MILKNITFQVSSSSSKYPDEKCDSDSKLFQLRESPDTKGAAAELRAPRTKLEPIFSATFPETEVVTSDTEEDTRPTVLVTPDTEFL